jgi:hypothetical protein
VDLDEPAHQRDLARRVLEPALDRLHLLRSGGQLAIAVLGRAPFLLAAEFEQDAPREEPGTGLPRIELARVRCRRERVLGPVEVEQHLGLPAPGLRVVGRDLEERVEQRVGLRRLAEVELAEGQPAQRLDLARRERQDLLVVRLRAVVLAEAVVAVAEHARVLQPLRRDGQVALEGDRRVAVALQAEVDDPQLVQGRRVLRLGVERAVELRERSREVASPDREDRFAHPRRDLAAQLPGSLLELGPASFSRPREASRIAPQRGGGPALRGGLQRQRDGQEDRDHRASGSSTTRT